MKYAFIIPDGCADEPQDVLNGRTPLQAAHTPHMDAIVQQGIVGRLKPVPDSMPSGSDIGMMSLFGYDPEVYHTGRAPLEAAAQGIHLHGGDWAVRCNLVTIEDGIMVSFTAGQIDDESARQLIEVLNQDQPGESSWSFYPGVSYRNLLICTANGAKVPFTRETQTVPPHDITGQSIEEHLPVGPGSDRLRQLMNRSTELFANASVNDARHRKGQLPATSIWLWGLGARPRLEPFAERFGKQGAVITAVDLLRGIGQLIGWNIVEVPGATGYTDTDYNAKGRYAVETLRDVDLVVVHVEATDEASHEGDAAAKVLALERIDSDIVAPLHEALRSYGDYRILISPDHPTFVRTKTHSHGFVPFGMCGTGITADAQTTYDEVAAAKSGLTVSLGYQLMPMFLDRR